jgi:dTDP-4-dehydrorhamnose reductase
MSTILITGSGMLACALRQAALAQDHEVRMLPHAELEITDRGAVRDIVRQLRPNLILHAAALTRVNYCEEHPDEAQLVNGTSVRYIVEAAESVMADLVYFSTDYVFDGQQSWPYQEDSLPNPINAYGRSKLMGEHAVEGYFRGYIIRTSGIFGPREGPAPERNFFRAIAQQVLQQCDQIPVVEDQMAAVTHASHLATITLNLLREEMPRLIHLCCGGSMAWYGWAQTVAQVLGCGLERICPVKTQELGGPVRRPAYSVLGSMHLAGRSMQALHPARPAVEAYVRSLAQSLA